MAVDGDANDSRTRVQTYVPANQRAEWEEQADSMDMSLSEFVRTMTQAGKRGFEKVVEKKPRPTPSSARDPEGSGLEDRVVAALSADEYVDWDELVDAVQEEFESELGDAIDELLARGEIEHRHGQGYTLA